MNKIQHETANLIILIGKQLHAPTVAVAACIFDCILESDLGAQVPESGGVGVGGAWNVTFSNEFNNSGPVGQVASGNWTSASDTLSGHPASFWGNKGWTELSAPVGSGLFNTLGPPRFTTGTFQRGQLMQITANGTTLTLPMSDVGNGSSGFNAAIGLTEDALAAFGLSPTVGSGGARIQLVGSGSLEVASGWGTRAGGGTQAPAAGGRNHVGILGGPSSVFGSSNTRAQMNAEITAFFKGGSGYHPAPGGAIALAKQYSDPSLLGPQVTAPFDPNNPPPYGQYTNESSMTGATGVALMALVKREAIAIVAAGGGGLLPPGTSGASPNTAPASPFSVGSTSNPDEDVWTAVNRLAQSRQWYIFSDGDVCYLADGNDIMLQPPVASVDRWANADQISHLNFTWDNTAFQYTSTHKRRARTPRKSTLAKVTSPVEATLDLICDIDAVRGGDVVELSGCGPGDGRWLVGDCTRSVFKIYSELTLVPGIQPLTEAAAEGATQGQSPNQPVPLRPGVMPSTPNAKGVIDPLPGWTVTTWDMGLDCTGPSNGAPIYAPCDCQIAYVIPQFYGPPHVPSWQPLVGFIATVTLAGAPTQYFYVSETFTPKSTTKGTSFAQGDIVGNYIAGLPNNVEIGWGSPTANSGRYAEQVGWIVAGNTDYHSPARTAGAPVDTPTGGTRWGNSFQDYFGVGGAGSLPAPPTGFTG